MSLYRTYRPQSFADVVGQEHIISTLETAVAQDKLSHAYLFAGQRGTGKTSVARILAKALLTRGVTDDALRRQIIRGVEEGSLVDLIEIDAASNRGIDDIRDLVEKIQFSPVAAAAKVYIIDEVHMLTREAFNALLKTLEEPPPYAYFILATTELQKIPATIQSRCQRYAFRQISDDDLIRRLQYIAMQEHIDVDREALRAMAHHAQGGMRDAIALLDQLRSLPKITETDVRERVGESAHGHVERIAAALESGDRQAIVDVVRTAEENGMAMDVLARQLLVSERSALHTTLERQEDPTRHLRTMDALLNTLRAVRNAPVPALALEAALLSLLCGSDPSSTPASPPANPARESRKSTPPAAAPARVEAPPDTTVRTEPKPAAILQAPELSAGELKRRWLDLLEAAKPPALRMSLKNGRIMLVEGTTVTLSFTSRFHRDRVAQKESLFALEHILEQMFKRRLRLECRVEEADAGLPDAPAVDLADAVAEVF
ncbi:MAG: Uncharacterized protein Greene041619_958 [Candidatus Peregrinibacteria bacterium Greene0416_19]|nr:MAG: Uncharacterized protein Greene041619_958 [Candidatus Peregrinibacteria bacterium Greene0416_19]